MAQHKSALKRIRQDEKKRSHNRYYAKTARTAIKNFRALTEKAEAEKFFPKVMSMIDKLAKNHIWHKNKAANVKGKLAKFVAKLG